MTEGKKRNLLIGIAFGAVISIGLCQYASAAEQAKVEDAKDQTSSDPAPKAKPSFSGNVSWYGPGLYGHKTASGEPLAKDKTTAAHRRLPFFTKVLVENPKTGKSCIVKVNDRGPYVKSRVMDLSYEGARRIGTLGNGVFYADCLVLDDDK